MRLRRETGDFSIKEVDGGYASIRTGLGIEDLIGVIKADASGASIATKTEVGDGGITITFADDTAIVYNPETGALTDAEEDVEPEPAAPVG